MTDPQRFIVRDKAIRGRAMYAVAHITHEPLMEVIVRPYRKDRTAAQNALLWMWCRQISEDFAHARGEENWFEPEAWKLEFQEKFLGMKTIKTPAGPKDVLIGTSELTTADFSAFLEKLDHYAGSVLKIALTHPQDLYLEAMGREA